MLTVNIVRCYHESRAEVEKFLVWNESPRGFDLQEDSGEQRIGEVKFTVNSVLLAVRESPRNQDRCKRFATAIVT